MSLKLSRHDLALENLLRDPSLPSDRRSVQQWFDTTAAVAPPAFTFGTAGRAVLTGPGLTQLSLSLLKNFRFKERYNVQFRAESLNFINHANWTDPDPMIGPASAPNVNAGRIIGSRGGRVIQVGLRFSF